MSTTSSESPFAKPPSSWLVHSKLARIGVVLILIVSIRVGVRYASRATHKKPASNVSAGTTDPVRLDPIVTGTSPAVLAPLPAVTGNGQLLAIDPIAPFPDQNPATGAWEAPAPTIFTPQGSVIGGPINVTGTQSPILGPGPMALRRQISAIEAELSSDEWRIRGLQAVSGASVLAQGVLIFDGIRKPNEGLGTEIIREGVDVLAEGLDAAAGNDRAQLQMKIDANRQRVQELLGQLTAYAKELQIADSLVGCWGYVFCKRGSTSPAGDCYAFSADGTIHAIHWNDTVATGTFEIINNGVSIQWQDGVTEEVSISWPGVNPDLLNFRITAHSSDVEFVGLDFLFTRIAASPNGTTPVGTGYVTLLNKSNVRPVRYQSRWKLATGIWTDWQERTVDEKELDYWPGGFHCEIRFAIDSTGTKWQNYTLPVDYASTLDPNQMVLMLRKYAFTTEPDGLGLKTD